MQISAEKSPGVFPAGLFFRKCGKYRILQIYAALVYNSMNIHAVYARTRERQTKPPFAGKSYDQKMACRRP